MNDIFGLMLDLQHFKLSNSNEILCEIVQWPDEEEDEQFFLVRNAIQIQLSADRMYVFKPWLMHNDGNEDLIILYADKVVANTNIGMVLQQQYIDAIIEMQQENYLREQEYRMAMTHRFNDFFMGAEDLLGEVTKKSPSRTKKYARDSAGTNVIRFPHYDSDVPGQRI